MQLKIKNEELRIEKGELNHVKNYSLFIINSKLARRAGFTLAEVLITLGIIGVVAAVTMPTLIANINTRVNSERQFNIVQKVTQAMEHMRALGKLDGSYKSTDEFVDELQNHLKISKRCNASNIEECWPTSKVINSDGDEYDVKNAKKGTDIKLKTNTTDNVGLILADGASLILTYNQDARAIDIGDRVEADSRNLPGMKTAMPYTTSATSSIDFIMDVNGKKGPNSETVGGKVGDIRSFKDATFGQCLAKVQGIGCLVDIGHDYEPDGTYVENPTLVRIYGFPEIQPDYWKGAVKACRDRGMELIDFPQATILHNVIDDYPQIGLTIWVNDEIDSTTGRFAYMDKGHNNASGYNWSWGNYRFRQFDAVCVK